jgi:hypothetical protein
METEKELNEKIHQVTMRIKKYPQLSKYLKEMEETIPKEKNPEINRMNLQTYHDSLSTMLQYVTEYAGDAE